MSGALSKNEAGYVVCDTDTCVGCFMCVMSCPHGFARPATGEQRIMIKCDGCSDRACSACVEACPTACLTLAETDEQGDGRGVYPSTQSAGGLLMRHVIIGNSAAGTAAAEAIREQDPAAQVIMLSQDTAFFSRCQLHLVASGQRPSAKTRFVPQDWAAASWHRGSSRS